MRDFAASAGRLRVLSFGAKLLYTAFAISAIIGLLVSWQLYGAAIGEGGDKVYYSGAAAEAKPAPEPPTAPAAEGDGPALDLPEEATAPRVMTEQISERKLLEVTHFHLFSVPVYVLILAHLWLLARMPSWLHTAGIVASVVTSGLHLAAPWIVRGRTGLSALMPISGVGMLVVMGIIAIVPAIDMWLPRPARRPADAGDGEAP
ncbi:MAG TPA: hypothetical protein VE093_23300 [Polyangiaceae bacterium]|nr:hypothetical protein [Polyangiaceae bacterium]